MWGDVGFGKTEVAMRAAFIAASAGKQVAVLVPTTLLAQQHYATFGDRLADWPIRVELLSRFRTGKQASAVLERLAEGGTDIVIGPNAAKPLRLDIPLFVSDMSFGALSAQAKEALGRGASEVGTSTTTGDGGMTLEERGQSSRLVYQYLPSRYGMNPDDLRKADAIEVVLGQGAKPGGGGMLLGQKISERVAGMSQSNRVQNRAEIRRLAQNWARMLREQLDAYAAPSE